ncbi:uncharacterized protein MONBRDRAFT_11305 [Monosiga brevicollis MX1]|uniref:DNA-directed primase/polymerase protein n=1 Tax=Monosiga brevicollis TaxID=81824 RepID=A9V8U4_MONBE|nr:uncharacterized protein MONBRDRAFT_11305 [Monosiga brevicollis MX1]EDQ85934.1 predicted protein [Monosiga brevicollis MX1]|eukprot:XP_001749128.1 hypothetical protein [Monosiga brevicollis MX1]
MLFPVPGCTCSSRRLGSLGSLVFRLTIMAQIWRTFKSQERAFRFADATLHPTRILSFELPGSTGRREFIVANDAGLQRNYALRPNDRFYYEMIRDGQPAHLYLDLEYSRRHNPSLDPERLTNSIIDALELTLRARCSPPAAANLELDTLVLDASTETKFSKHVIFKVPGYAFPDNLAAGCCLRTVLLQALERRTRLEVLETTSAMEEVLGATTDSAPLTEQPTPAQEAIDALARCLFVVGRDGALTLFVDCGVYSRNRNFRLYLSRKRGKANPLCFDSALSRLRTPTARQIWLPSPTSTDLTDELAPASVPKAPSDPWASDSALGLARLKSSLITHHEHPEQLRWLVWPEPNIPARYTRWLGVALHHGTGGACSYGSSHNRPTSVPTAMGMASPFPSIDDYVTQVCQDERHRGRIRRCFYFAQTKTITYDLDHYRFCHNIGRHHRSNGSAQPNSLIGDAADRVCCSTQLTRVDLLCYAFQKCHDPDCRALDYRSPPFRMPVELVPFEPPAPWSEADDQADEAHEVTPSEPPSQTPTLHAQGGAERAFETDLKEQDVPLEHASPLDAPPSATQRHSFPEKHTRKTEAEQQGATEGEDTAEDALDATVLQYLENFD